MSPSYLTNWETKSKKGGTHLDCAKARIRTQTSWHPTQIPVLLASALSLCWYPYCGCRRPGPIAPSWLFPADSLHTSSPASTWLPRWSSEVQSHLCCVKSFRCSHHMWDNVHMLSDYPVGSERSSPEPQACLSFFSPKEPISQLCSSVNRDTIHGCPHSSCSLCPDHHLNLSSW